MSQRKILAGVGVFGALALAAFLITRPDAEPVAAIQATDDSPSLASLGDQHVSSNELKALLNQLPESARQQLLADRNALEAWIRTRLAEKALYQQAVTAGWSQRPEVQEQTRLAVEQIVMRSYLNSVSQVPDDYPSEQELEQAYDAGKESLQIAAIYRLSQIFLAVPDEASAEGVLKQAQDLSKRAQQPDADFAELAREHSQDPGSAALGGDIGPQQLAQLLPEVRSTVPKLEIGEISKPLLSSQGYHILKLIDAQPARTATLDEVREQLRVALRAQRQEQLANAHLEKMFNNATLSIDGAALNQVNDAQP